MGLLSFFGKPRVQLPSIQHPVFGSMQATIAHDDGTLFWESNEDKHTAKGSIRAFCDAGEAGPTTEQVALWEHIYEHFEGYRQQAEPLLADTLTGFGWSSELPGLRWIAVGLAKDGSPESAWDLGFETSTGAILTVYFEHGTPTTVSVDN